ncbi:MAG TPA: hypothetical protein VN579_04205, partial [Bryobacteraceae bacterium]|nr:hypothetical protein [Bryobacteraceae bacterium]
EPIAGITPIEQMIPVSRMSDTPVRIAAAGDDADTPRARASKGGEIDSNGMTFKPMETPLVMAGFEPAAVALWQKEMSGTALQQVAAGGVGGGSPDDMKLSPAAEAALQPGSSISALLVRGDLEVSATCTVTYIDARHLLACGHPIFQLGPISMPMATSEVVATLASPLNAFKIINTGVTVGAFTEDRDSAIGGLLGAEAKMIPVHITVHDSTGNGAGQNAGGERHVNVEILDQASLTPQALTVVLYDALLQNNDSGTETSFHLTGNIDVQGYPALPLNLWASAGDPIPASMATALRTGQQFSQIYTNSGRMGAVREVNLNVETVPRFAKVELESARLISNDIVHAGDTVVVEATIRPWRQAARNIRIPIKIPARMNSGNVRLLVSDAGTLDRTLNQPHSTAGSPSLASVLAEDRRAHAEDCVYVSLLVPEAQAGMDGHTLTDLPISVANALEPVRDSRQIVMNGESADVVGQASADGLVAGYQILNLHVEAGSGLN